MSTGVQESGVKTTTCFGHPPRRSQSQHTTSGPVYTRTIHNTQYTRRNPRHVPWLPERAGVARVGPDLQKGGIGFGGAPHTKLPGPGSGTTTSAARFRPASPCAAPPRHCPPPPPAPAPPAVARWSRHAVGAAPSPCTVPRTSAHAAFASASICEFVRADMRC